MSLKKHISSKRISPTTLISPNGLEILDVLFRLPAVELNRFSSALQFTKKFELSQPKLSKLMNAFRADGLLELRSQISGLPVTWWIQAMDYPLTKKGLLPFLQVSRPFRSLQKRLPKILDRTIIPGPPLVASALGSIRDQSLYFWGTRESIQTFKQKYRLVPGMSPTEVICHLATARDLTEDVIVSKIPTRLPFAMNLQAGRANLFRSIWDMSFGDNRLREARFRCLERLVHEV